MEKPQEESKSKKSRAENYSASKDSITTNVASSKSQAEANAIPPEDPNTFKQKVLGEDKRLGELVDQVIKSLEVHGGIHSRCVDTILALIEEILQVYI